MNREEYQNAFSWLEPSQTAVETAALRGEPRRTRRTVRPGAVLLAAVLTVALLTGAVFAAGEFGWFRLGGAEKLAAPADADPDAFGKREALSPAPQSLMTLDGEPSDSYIGFTLPASYLSGRDERNCWMLDETLYRRYYRNPEPDDPDSPLLTVEIVYDAAYLTRYPSELVKEDVLNDMQTVWLRLDGSEDGRTQYCLFQRSDALGCFAVIASTVSFEEAEQAAGDLRLADSGIPLAQKAEQLWYGFRLGWTPEDMQLDSSVTLADRWYLANATLRDPNLDLTRLLRSSNWVCEGEPSCSIGVWISETKEEPAPIANGEMYRTGTLCGHEAHWVHGADGNTYLEVLFPEQEVLLCAEVSCFAPDESTGELVPVPTEECRVEIAERLLNGAELVPVAIAEPAPLDFSPFSVG